MVLEAPGGVPDGPDVRMVTDKVDTVVLAVDDVDDPRWSPGLQQQLHQRHAGGGVTLGWLGEVSHGLDGGSTFMM